MKIDIFFRIILVLSGLVIHLFQQYFHSIAMFSKNWLWKTHLERGHEINDNMLTNLTCH